MGPIQKATRREKRKQKAWACNGYRAIGRVSREIRRQELFDQDIEEFYGKKK